MKEEKNISNSLFRLMRNLRRRPKEDKHLSRSSFMVLRLLSKEDGRSSKELSQDLDIRASSLSEVLARMEEEGLVSRSKDPEDMRVSRVYLSDKGRQFLERNRLERLESEKSLEAWLSPEEREELIRICDKLSQKLEESRREEESL